MHSADDLIRLDRGRKGKKLSHEDWVSGTDPEAKIARMKDGGHALQHLPVGLARAPAHDRPQRGVRLHGRGVDSDPLAFHQAALGRSATAPTRTPARGPRAAGGSRFRQPRIIRHPLGRPQTQKLTQRQRVRTAPFDPALGVNAFEVADHVHPEVPAGRN